MLLAKDAMDVQQDVLVSVKQAVRLFVKVVLKIIRPDVLVAVKQDVLALVRPDAQVVFVVVVLAAIAVLGVQVVLVV